MRRFATALLVALMATIGIAACGGDDDDDTNASEQENSDSADGDGDESTSTTGADEIDGDLSDLLDRQSDAVIKITYDDGDEGFVIAQDHEKRAITTSSSLIITTEDGTVTCDDIDTEPTCTQVPEGFEGLASFGLGFFDMIAQGLVQAADSVDGLETSDEEIAGRDATCVDYDAGSLLGGLVDELDISTDDVPEGSARVCVDKETGFLLEFTAEDGDNETQSIVATKVEEPSDADFEPPAEVQESPDLGNIDDLIEQNT